MVIILGVGDLTKVSPLQWLAVFKSLVLAAKAPAEDFLADRQTKKRQTDCAVTLYHEKGFGEKLLMIGKDSSNLFLTWTFVTLA